MIGDKLKELRSKMNLTQSEVSKLLDIKQNTYSGYESNKHEPDLNMLSKMASLFKVTTDYLLGLSTKK